MATTYGARPLARCLAIQLQVVSGIAELDLAKAVGMTAAALREQTINNARGIIPSG